jgi:hypothetical protein
MLVVTGCDLDVSQQEMYMGWCGRFGTKKYPLPLQGIELKPRSL